MSAIRSRRAYVSTSGAFGAFGAPPIVPRGVAHASTSVAISVMLRRGQRTGIEQLAHIWRQRDDALRRIERNENRPRGSQHLSGLGIRYGIIKGDGARGNLAQRGGDPDEVVVSGRRPVADAGI